MKNDLLIATTKYHESLDNLVNYMVKEYADGDFNLKEDVNLREILLLELVNDFIERAGDIKRIAMDLDLEMLNRKFNYYNERVGS